MTIEWCPTMFPNCEKHVVNDETVVWVDGDCLTYTYKCSASVHPSGLMTPAIPWPPGMSREEVKLIAYAAWRLTR